MDNSKKQQEEFTKATGGKEGGEQGDFALKHLKKRMNMNVEKSIKIEASKWFFIDWIFYQYICVFLMKWKYTN